MPSRQTWRKSTKGVQKGLLGSNKTSSTQLAMGYGSKPFGGKTNVNRTDSTDLHVAGQNPRYLFDLFWDGCPPIIVVFFEGFLGVHFGNYQGFYPI